MNPFAIAGGVAGVLTLVEYAKSGAGTGSECTAFADAKAQPQDNLDDAQAVLKGLIDKADAGRALGQYTEAIDYKLGTAKDQYAGASNTFFSPDLNDTQDAIADLAAAMDADCVFKDAFGAKGAGAISAGWKSTSPFAVVGDAIIDGAHWVLGLPGRLIGALVPDWVWGVLVVGGIVVGGYLLTHPQVVAGFL